ncbi:MAG: 2Fe-2S iron-sulfur cluster-binding protein [Saprospiraceae bacterium]
MENIIKITVLDRHKHSVDIEVPTDIGLNMMEVCKSYGLPVEGICGGMALCASCHMYVLSNHQMKEPSEDEENMLDQAFFVKSNSRLGCQIKLSNDLDGLEVELAPVNSENDH